MPLLSSKLKVKNHQFLTLKQIRSFMICNRMKRIDIITRDRVKDIYQWNFVYKTGDQYRIDHQESHPLIKEFMSSVMNMPNLIFIDNHRCYLYGEGFYFNFKEKDDFPEIPRNPSIPHTDLKEWLNYQFDHAMSFYLKSQSMLIEINYSDLILETYDIMKSKECVKSIKALVEQKVMYV